jgi:hypothetical protein
MWVSTVGMYIGTIQQNQIIYCEQHRDVYPHYDIQTYILTERNTLTRYRNEQLVFHPLGLCLGPKSIFAYDFELADIFKSENDSEVAMTTPNQSFL